MKRLLLATLFILMMVISANSEILWQENFDGFPDFTCGTSAGGTSVTCTCPIKAGEGTSPYSLCQADIQEWGISGEAPYVLGINSSAGRTGKGFRINLRAHPRTVGYDGENILRTKVFNSSYRPAIHLRWYMRDSWANWSNSSYQKLFRLKDNSEQWSIPEWYSTTPYRVWHRAGTLANYSNISDVANAWVCYEIRWDFAARTVETWVNGVSKGVKSVAELSNNYVLNLIELGGNQHNINCWTPFVGYKSRDYDDIVIATEYIGPTGASVYTVGGSVSGYPGGTLTLRNTINGSTTDDKSITANGAYTFSTSLSSGSTYSVSVTAQPSGYTCNVANATGTIDASNITNINVTCSSTPTRRLGGGRISGGRVR